MLRYCGGKARQLKLIESCVESVREGRNVFVEPFMGACWVTAHMAPLFNEVRASDCLEDLSLFWNAVLFEDWSPPLELSREQWHHLKMSEPSPERCWAGLAGSYSGIWFCSYGVGAYGKNPHDYLAESYRSTAKKVAKLRQGNVSFSHLDYHDIDLSGDPVVYCDPPYAETARYRSGPKFDSDEFWRWATEMSSEGHLILVHEFKAPQGWEPLIGAVRSDTATPAKNKSSNKRTESIFIYTGTR